MNFCTLLAVFAVIGSSVSFRLDSSADNINSDRIINGSFASPGQFPYMVSVRRNGFGDTEWRRHICGGSLISNRWVISAARCVHQSFVRQYWIAVGAHHLFSDGAAYRVSRVVNHPGFSGTPLLRNDISLIQTDAPIHFTDRIRPIPLSRQFVGAGVASIASGWGLNRNISSPYRPFPTHMQFLRQTTITNEECRRQHRPPQLAIINNATLCAFARRFQGLCEYDFGNPLAANGQLVGIASWTRHCAAGVPDGFVRVSVFLDWIREVSGVAAV